MKDKFDPSGERSIAAYSESERLRRKSTPNLWKIPQMTPDLPPSVEKQLKEFQTTYTNLLYSVGASRYGLRREFDFVVDVIVPSQNMQDLGAHYSVFGGPVVTVVMPVCPIHIFEENIHRILRDVKDCLTTKALDIRTKLLERSEELKQFVVPFAPYKDLERHHLEITVERIVTIVDRDTKVTVSRTKREDQEATRLMIHRAKLELIEINGLVRELEEQSEKEAENAQQINEVKV